MKKVILGVAAFVVLGFGAGAFAYQQSVNAAMSGSDSCPMKSMAHAGHETASCCDNCDCCVGQHTATGDASCPMHNKAEQPEAAATGEAAAVHAENCGCPCCASKSDA